MLILDAVYWLPDVLGSDGDGFGEIGLNLKRRVDLTSDDGSPESKNWILLSGDLKNPSESFYG